MTKDELQDLSRRTANALVGADLPNRWNIGPDGHRTGALYIYRDIWLHESTEACTEIMVRVLMPQRVDLDWINDQRIYASRRPDYLGSRPSITIARAESDDPMQAFRTAVLLALCEVMG